MKELRKAIQGGWATRPMGGVASGISTDTRTLSPGELFVALKGENHDGHSFLSEAAEKGACGAVVERIPEEFQADEYDEFGLIQVSDTLRALGDLGAYYRNLINARVIAITGSSGKSTTKEIIAHLLSGQYAVASSPKSYNNRIGVPLTLFRTNPSHDYVVSEAGTNQPGDIARLGEILKPDVAVLTNIGKTHLEGLKSIEGVKQEKSDLLHHLSGNGTVIYNADNRYVREVVEEYGIDGISFGLYSDADFRASDLNSTMDGISFRVNEQVDVEFPLPGGWNASNVLAGMAVASEAGLSLEESADRLTSYRGLPKRMKIEKLDNVMVLNDAYNSNPRSVQLVLDELDHWDISGRILLVLGDMAELGEQSEELHREVGAGVAKKKNIHEVHFVGKQMKYAAEEARENSSGKITIHEHQTTEEAIPDVLNALQPGDFLAVKGSRKMELEAIPERLKQEVSSRKLKKN